MEKKPLDIFSTRIDSKIHRSVKDYCNKNGLKIQVFTEKALIEKLDKDGRYAQSSRRNA